MPSASANTILPVSQWRGAIGRQSGIRLAASGWIPEEPRAIALISHGHAEHLGRYGHVITPLVADGFAVFGLDHRGHGRSTGTRALITDMDRAADDLHALAMHAVSRLPKLPVALVGHSMGGLIALRHALRYQYDLTALVTSGAALVIAEGTPPVAIPVVEALGGIMPKAPMPRSEGDGCVLSTEQDICDQFGIDHRTWHGSTRLGTVAAMLEAGEDTRNRFADLHLPLLAMHGAADTLTNPRGSELLYAGASSEDKTLILWEGRRHEIFNSPGRDTVIDTMRMWLVERVLG